MHRSKIAAPAGVVFEWHERPGAFERLTPPWERMAVVERSGGIEDGARAVLEMRIGPLATRWTAEHCDYVKGRQFRDVQIAGPFARWEHTHRVEPAGPDACYLEDHVEYALPLGAIGALLGGAAVRRRLRRTFAYRHRVTGQDIAAHARTGGRRMKVAITGSTGLLGSALLPMLTSGGHEVVRIVRHGARTRNAISWDPDASTIDGAALEGMDAVVHLAGESIFGRWTAAKKARIRDSRVNGTHLLVETLNRLAQPPKVLVAASAIGYYGHRADDIVDEESAPGAGFLCDVCREWEAATQSAARRMRVVNLRFGVVLSPAGGALATMLTPFRLGVGGPIGGGGQYMSWIAIDDAIGAILHALTTPQLSGPVNVVSPDPVQNRAFAAMLARVLSRPAFLPLPAFVAKLALGEMADELLLASTRVEPQRLKDTGYAFRWPELEPALRHLLGKSDA